ncbi:uncharacterized protein PRCAT00002496001 [Priceomyces carsonii]|uniref:uncharacterized protein n=1 Tax=Priceomyces carsonii TaxID=28549 RepID=UPI002EDB5F4D|nr:unnamed protein product [Priceomyces carsonii]
MTSKAELQKGLTVESSSIQEPFLKSSDAFNKKDLIEVENGNEILSKKMFLINNAIDEIGFTWYHAKLFCISGFGYSADSQLEMIQSSVSLYVNYQFGRSFPVATEIFYVGLLFGSLFWGLGGDIIGRKIAFNWSLFLAALFGFFVGGMNSYATYCIFLFLNAACAGGNLALDVAVFLEYLPSKYQWLNTFLAAWWGIGQTIAVALAWAFIPNFSCDLEGDCPSSSNRGWRYCWYANSAICMCGALVRLLFFKLDETPKFLVSNGRDEEAVESLRKIALKYDRPFSLTLEDLESCGELLDVFKKTKHELGQDESLWSKAISTWKLIKKHVKILFATKLVAYSTSLILWSWFLIGLAYDTFYNFLYIYIAEKGGNVNSVSMVYRDPVIANFVGIWSPMLAAAMVFIPKCGRRGTMAFGAVSSMAILFGYTTVRSAAGDAGFSSATYFFINIYYACLYAYTPEVFPAQARTTGTALAVTMARVGGVVTPVIYYYGQESGSSVPIWVCGAAVGTLAVTSLMMPFEPTLQRTV